MKVKEIVYIILDLCKVISDDSIINEDHVLFLAKKYRSFLIKKEEEKEKSSTDVASEFEYQEICLDLEKVAAIDGDPCTGGYYLRSTGKIPKILEGTQPRVYPIDFYQGINITYVPRDRMRFVGTNKYLQNIIYTSLGPDQFLYLNSSNPQFSYLKKIRMSAIFEDFDEAVKEEYKCPEDESSGEDSSCDVLDAEFPIREYLVPSLIELVVKELVGAKYQIADTKNDARDTIQDLINDRFANSRGRVYEGQ